MLLLCLLTVALRSRYTPTLTFLSPPPALAPGTTLGAEVANPIPGLDAPFDLEVWRHRDMNTEVEVVHDARLRRNYNLLFAANWCLK